MNYSFSSIPDAKIPRARIPLLQHCLDTYTSEINKVLSVWACFSESHLNYRPDPRSASVVNIMKHQLLSERRFFAEFLSAPEVPADSVLPRDPSAENLRQRLLDLAVSRLAFLAEREESWWLAVVPFFDVQRERIWIFWRRVLHTAHHRTQLTVYLRLLGKDVPSTYGPTADVTWNGADPTTTTEAAGRG